MRIFIIEITKEVYKLKLLSKNKPKKNKIKKEL